MMSKREQMVALVALLLVLAVVVFSLFLVPRTSPCNSWEQRMASEFEFEIQGLDELIRDLDDPQIIGRSARKMLNGIGLTVEENVKTQTPVDTGRARQSITFEVDSSVVPLFVRVGSNLEYIAALEFGTKPHFPPLDALQPWARRHGFPPGRAGAFLVARAIAEKGTKARRMFQKGAEASQGAIVQLARTAEDEIVRDLSK